ncbi:MAG: biopolymer transporter ExbD [Burkholderiales bacterium]|nr:biopolymer transporter ExbD [Burkholderiales bacterium]
MKFRRHSIEDPEINLIPLIDVLLVILIFLMLSMTYSRFTALQVDLPVANAERMPERPAEIVVAVAADGRTMVRGEPVDGRDVDLIAAAIADAAAGRDDAFVVVSADALAAHQSVMNVLDAARRAGIVRLTFAAQSGAGR